MKRRVLVIVEKDEAGYFAYCPKLKGCHSQGDTLDEVIRNIREAVSLYIETLDEAELRDLLEGDVFTAHVEVDVDAEVA